MANIGTTIHTIIFGHKVGTDEFGNKYYTRRNSKSGRRWVIYNGIAEASKVPAPWHRWLHKTTDDLPVDSKTYDWEKPHLPNLTGTDMAYLPKGHAQSGEERNPATGDYEAWKPE